MNAGPSARRAIGGAALAGLAMLVLVGCSQGPKQLEGTLPATNDLRPLPIRLFDHSNTVTALELSALSPDRPAGLASDDFAAAVPGRANAVFLVWLGGMCDEQVDVEYTGGDRTFTVSTTAGQGGCRLAGIVRSVIVTFGAPIDASTFEVQQFR